MSKFNSTKKPVKHTPNAINAAGGLAYKMSDKKALVEALLTSFASSTYYTDAQTHLKEVEKLIASCGDPLFAAKAAVYARDHYGMRSITHFVAGQLAAQNLLSGKDWAKDFFSAIVIRPDDMSEILSAYQVSGGKKVPNALKKGFAKAFNKFSGETLSKYTMLNKEIKLVDIVNLVHPRPTVKNKGALEALVKNSLRNKTTTSRALTAIGQKASSEEEKESLTKEYFYSVLSEGKLGYIDMIRNLVKINSTGDAKVISLACKQIVTQELIKKSRVMPYTLYLAYKMCENSGVSKKITNALQEALEYSLDNIPEFAGNTVVVVDCSGSMTTPVNGNNRTATYKVSCNEVAAIFAAMLAKKIGADVVKFDTTAKHIRLNSRDSVITLSNSIAFNGGGTDFGCIFPVFRKKYDRVIILSDMQGWGDTLESYVKQYRTKYNANPRIYSWNLAQNGTIQAPEKMVRLLAGFSDKCFEAIKLLEEDAEGLIKEIEKVSFN